MEALVKPIEQVLMPLFKGLPSLPEGIKKTLVKIWPVLALIFGLLQAWAAYALWNLGHATNSIVNYANELSIATGGGAITPSLGLWYYLGLGVVVIDAVLMLLAVAPLNGRKKSGWDLIVLGATLNLVYGIVLVFDSYYGGFGNLLSTLIGSAIGFYLLFQVRDYYTGAKSVDSTSTTPTTTAGKPSAK